MIVVAWFLDLDAAPQLAILVALTALVNAVIDRGLGAPADSSPEWAAFAARRPRVAGIVKLWRACGLDVLKGVAGLLMFATGSAKHDPSSVRPPPNQDGGLE